MRYVAMSLALCVSISGCNSCERVSEAERQRSQEEAQIIAELKAKLERDLATLTESGSCTDCVIDLDLTTRTDFRGSILTASVVGCEKCEGKDLRNADLRRARLDGRLNGLDIRGAKVDGASFGGASSMTGMRMDGIDLRKVQGADGTNWSGAILTDANLDKVSFMGAAGRHGHFKTSDNPMNVGLGGALAVGTDFRGASLRKTNFGVCNLEGARFDDADAEGIIIDLTNLKDASFVGANMQNAYAGTASAIGTNFSNVKAKGAHFAKANLTNAKFENADLRGANFKDAVIQGTRFDNADLSGATWIDGTRCKKGSIGKCQTR